MDQLIVNGIALQVDANPKLIFKANSLESRGRSHSSYSVIIPNNTYNNQALGGIFDRQYERTIRFNAIYEVGGFVFNGNLLITDMNRNTAKGVFVSGNGTLWGGLQDKNLHNFSWDKFNTVLNIVNVGDLLTEPPDVLWIQADYGKFKRDNSIDISEMYPALKIGAMIETIFNDSGVGVSWNIPDAYMDLLTKETYLLFTQDTNVRNSEEWMRESEISVKPTVGGFGVPDSCRRYQESGSAGSFDINISLEFPEVDTNTGGNWSTAFHRYRTSESGAYRFRFPFSIRLSRSVPTTDSFIEVRVYNTTSATSLGSKVYSGAGISWDTSGGTDRAYFSDVLDVMPTEVEETQDIEIQFRWLGTTALAYEFWIDHAVDIDNVIPWDNSLPLNAGLLEVFGSRWYGNGSLVQMVFSLPDISVLDWLAGLFKYLNMDVFYQVETNQIEIQQNAFEIAPIDTLEVYDYNEKIQERKFFELEYQTDKTMPPPNDLLKIEKKGVSSISFNYSRTLMAPCFRLFGETDTLMPNLWSEGDPNSYLAQLDPPDNETKANPRLLRFIGDSAQDLFDTTYGALSTDKVPIRQVEELPIRDLWFQSLTPEPVTITAKAQMTAKEINFMYDQTYFKRPIMLRDRRTGKIHAKAQLLEARQLSGFVFELKLKKV